MFDKSNKKDADFEEFTNNLHQWLIPDEAVDSVHDAARASLDEVKSLTEYEDGKVSRLLTIIAFLSAVVGAVFTRFASNYAPPKLNDILANWDNALPALTYFLFLAYILLVSGSVFWLLGAVQPRFNFPATWKGMGKTGLPPSMVFYKGILDVSAKNWGQAFEELTGNEGVGLKNTMLNAI